MSSEEEKKIKEKNNLSDFLEEALSQLKIEDAFKLEEPECRLELPKAELLLKKNPKDIRTLCLLASIHNQLGKRVKANLFYHKAMSLFKDNFEKYNDDSSDNDMILRGFDIIIVGLKFWKDSRYASKTQKDLHLNITGERGQVISEIKAIVALLQKNKTHMHLANQYMAYINECEGLFRDSLALLSDLISEQVQNTTTDLSYVIFKAGVILKHIGDPIQSIEYMEFLVDDPPSHEGLTKTYVIAILADLYESSGDKYQIFLNTTYKDLFASYEADLKSAHESKEKNITTHAAFNKKKLDELKKTIQQSSEIWEILALQALDKCEYVMAIEFMNKALEKSPGKHKLLQILAEIYYILGDKKKCLDYAEKAVIHFPNSGELRNLLLIVDPQKYSSQLRSAPITKSNDDNRKDTSKVKKSNAKPAKTTKSTNGENRPKSPAGVSQRGKSIKRIAATEEKPTGWFARNIFGKSSPSKQNEVSQKTKTRTKSKAMRAKKKVDEVKPIIYKLEKPILNEEEIRMLQLAQRGKIKTVYYDDTLDFFAKLRNTHI